MRQAQWLDRRTDTPMTCLREVVLVEDNPADAAMVARVFGEARAWHRLIHFDNWRSALTHLQNRSAEKPALILLALQRSDRSAWQFLAALKDDETLKMIPVVVLAQAGEPQDVSASFLLGIAGYVVKAADPVQWRKDATTICTYWALNRSPSP